MDSVAVFVEVVSKETVKPRRFVDGTRTNLNLQMNANLRNLESNHSETRTNLNLYNLEAKHSGRGRIRNTMKQERTVTFEKPSRGGEME